MTTKLTTEKLIGGVNNTAPFTDGVNSGVGSFRQFYGEVDRKYPYQAYGIENCQLSTASPEVDTKFIAELTHCHGCRSRVHRTWITCPDCHAPIDADLYERFLERAAIIEFDGGVTRQEATAALTEMRMIRRE